MLTFLGESVNHPRVDAVIDRMDNKERATLVAVTEQWGRLLSEKAFDSPHKTERPVRIPPAPFVDVSPPGLAERPKNPIDAERNPVGVVEPATQGAPPLGQYTVFDLKRTSCRAPMSCEDGARTTHKFCGRDAVDGLQYCVHHAKMCYQSLSRRARERLLIEALEK